MTSPAFRKSLSPKTAAFLPATKFTYCSDSIENFIVSDWSPTTEGVLHIHSLGESHSPQDNGHHSRRPPKPPHVDPGFDYRHRESFFVSFRNKLNDARA